MNEHLLNHPLINARARQQLFRSIVSEPKRYSDGVEFTLVLTNKEMQDLAGNSCGHAQLAAQVQTWLGTYFPDMPIHIDKTPGKATYSVNGERQSLPTLRIGVEGGDALRQFNALMSNQPALPDYQHLVHALDSDEEHQRYLMERVTGEPKPFKGALEGQLHVDFSVPRGRGGQLRDEFWEQYGKNVSFKCPAGDGLMVTVGATLKGETAQRFLSDYNHYKGRD